MNIGKTIKDYTILAAGSFFVAFGINYFLVPMKISTGGVSGIGTVFYYVFGLPLSVTTLVLNLLLFIFGFRMLKKSSIVKTAAGIVLMSLFLEITENFGTYREDILISSVFGGVLIGAGVGLTVLREASTGGSDFAALMLNKAIPHMSVTKLILLIDSAVIIVSGIVFKNYTIMFYSVISLYISSKVADFILVSGDYAKSVYIVSEKSREIADIIMRDMQRGVTGVYSHGCYNGNDGMMLMCIVKAKEIPALTEKVKSIDKSAFTVISDVREVRGEGFKEN